MLWLLGWDGARRNPCAWSSAVVLPTLKKRCVYVGRFIHTFKKKRNKYLLNTHYMPGQCISAKDQKYKMSKPQSLHSEGPMAQILDRYILSTCYINKLFWLHIAHMALFYSTWKSNGNRTVAFSLIRLNCSIHIMKFKINFLFLMITLAILNTNKTIQNPYWIKWVNEFMENYIIIE